MDRRSFSVFSGQKSLYTYFMADDLFRVFSGQKIWTGRPWIEVLFKVFYGLKTFNGSFIHRRPFINLLWTDGFLQDILWTKNLEQGFYGKKTFFRSFINRLPYTGPDRRLFTSLPLGETFFRSSFTEDFLQSFYELIFYADRIPWTSPWIDDFV